MSHIAQRLNRLGAMIVEEVALGAKSRPIHKTLLEQLCKGNTLIVSVLERLEHHATEVLLLVEDLN